MDNETSALSEGEKFRANIYAIEAVFEAAREAIAKEYNKKKEDKLYKIDNLALYEWLHTNRYDVSRYMKGGKEKPTETMQKIYDEHYGSVFRKIYDQRELVIKLKDAKWRELFEQNKKNTIEELKGEVKVTAENALKSMKEEEPLETTPDKGIAFELCQWMLHKIAEQYAKKNPQFQENIKGKAKACFEISFAELDRCDLETMEYLYKCSKKFYEQVNAIYKYKNQRDSKGKESKK